MRKEVCHLVIMEDERPRRVNGLSPPYTGAQLSTWILLPVLVLQFLFFSTPLLPLEASIPCTLCFIALAGFSTYFAYVAMNIDPADPRLEPHDPNSESRWETDAPTKQCWICDKQVGEKSMHCKYCNKCVDHFDHHCMCKVFVFHFSATLFALWILTCMLWYHCKRTRQGSTLALAKPTTNSFLEPWFQSQECYL